MASHIAQAFIVILAVILVNSCFAQLTFSPNWGKRSGTGSNQLDIGNSATLNDNNIGDSAFRFGTVRNMPNLNGHNNCKPSIDSMMLIYRMIQAEAEKLDDCNQK